jgi:hypothetical protein
MACIKEGILTAVTTMITATTTTSSSMVNPRIRLFCFGEFLESVNKALSPAGVFLAPCETHFSFVALQEGAFGRPTFEVP